MSKICLLTGLDGETTLKKMCINCIHSKYIEESDKYTCSNEKVMEIGYEKVAAKAKELGFDIDFLTLKPMELKNPTKKCDNYSPNMENIRLYVEQMFNN